MGFWLGSKHCDRSLAGLTDILGHVLKKGTRRRSHEEISDAVDFRGGFVGATSGPDYFYVFGEFLTEFATFGFELLSEIVRMPAFSEAILEKEKVRMIADLENERSSPGFLAEKQIVSSLYQPHPYGFHRDAESVGRINVAGLEAIHASYFQPGNAVLVVGGDIKTEQAVALSREHFGGWQAVTPRPQLNIEEPATAARCTYLIDRPGAQQVNLIAGNQLFKRSHPDYEKMALANRVLGASGSGRLFLKLREEKGYTYSASSSMDINEDCGAWVAQADTRPEVAVDALSLLIDELERFRLTPVTEDELNRARRYMVGVFPLRNEAPSSIANLALWQRLSGFKEGYWAEHLARLEKVSVEDVQTVAREWIRPDQMTVVAVGDASSLENELRQFGKVKVLNDRLEPRS